MLVADEKTITLTAAGLTLKQVENLYVGDKMCMSKGTPTISTFLKWRDAIWICTGTGGTLETRRWELHRLTPLEEFAASFPHVKTRDTYADSAGDENRDSGLGYYAGLLIKVKGNLYRIAPYSEDVALCTDDWPEAQRKHAEWVKAGCPEWNVWVGDLSSGRFQWSRPFSSELETSARLQFSKYCNVGWANEYPYPQRQLPPVVLVDPDGDAVYAHFPSGLDRKAWIAAMEYFMGWSDWTPELQAEFLEQVNALDPQPDCDTPPEPAAPAAPRTAVQKSLFDDEPVTSRTQQVWLF